MKNGDRRQKEEDRDYKSIFDAVYDGLVITDLETGTVVEANPAACMMHGYSRGDFIGLSLTDLVHKESRRAFDKGIQDFQGDAGLDMRVQHVSRDGDTFFAEWRANPVAFRGKSCLLSIIRDISKRNHAEQLLRKQVKTRTTEQETLLAISHILASTVQLQPDLVLEQLREILDYSRGGFFAVENSSLVALAMIGTQDMEQGTPLHIHLQGPEILAGLFSGNDPVRIAEVWGDQPEAQTLRALLDDEAAALLRGMQSWMWVPLRAADRIFGCIGVAHKQRSYFTSHHADLALSVANLAAISMANAELTQQARSLVALEERQRFARNLHDAINQSLFSAGIIAEVLPRIWEQDQDLVLPSLRDLRRLILGSQAEMRALLAELRPDTLIDSNIAELLQLLGNVLSGRKDIPVIVTVSGEARLPTEVKIVFYRVCQEAMNNIAKHAEASRVEIDLTHNGAVTELRIRDDGRGFEPNPTPAGHLGLVMMKERTDAVGAQFSIISQPGRGTELAVHWKNPSTREMQ